MGRYLRTPVNPKEILLENILIAMEEVTFSKDTAARIVGGIKRLEDLIASGEIYAEKGTSAQNSKWKCNASHVLRHCRNFREVKSKSRL